MARPDKKDDDEVYAKYELLPEASPRQPNVALPHDLNLQPPSEQSEKAPRDSLSQWFQDQIDRESAEINLSGADPHTIVSRSLAADAILDRLCKEVLPGLPEIRAAIRQEDDVARFNETVLKAAQMACYWLAVLRETNKIIFERLSKNGTNRNFGFFVLGAITGNKQINRNAQEELLRIALSIPFKKEWFHPREPEVWKERATSVLYKEVTKHQHLDVSGVLERMVGNQFAYIYIAFEREFKDELRTVYRRPPEHQFPEFEPEAFGSEAQEIEAVEAEKQRQDLIKVVSQLEESPMLEPGPRAFMHQLLIYLKEPSKYLDLDRGHAVREVALRLGVTVQQARSYRADLSSTAKQEDSDIGKLEKQVRKLRLRFCKEDGNEEGDH